MPWLTLKHSPGFCPDLTSWTIEIDSDGTFRQQVEMDRPVRRSHRYDNRVLIYKGKLSELHVGTLRNLVDAIDFNGLNSFDGYPCVTDCSEQRIVIEEGSGTRSFKGPIFLYLRHQKMTENRPDFMRARLPDHLTLQELTDLWTFVHDLAPFPPDDERDTPRQERALPLPEMELEVRKPEIPEEFRRPPRPEVPVTFDEIKLRLEAALVKVWELLAQKISHECPPRAKFQILEFYWPEDDGSPECEREHLRILSKDGLSVDEAVRGLLYDGRMSSVSLVPSRVEDGYTYFKLLAQIGRVDTVYARSQPTESHPINLYTGAITPMDPEVCLGGEKFALQEQRFWDYYAGRIGDQT